MNKNVRPLAGFIALAFAMLACSSSFEVMGTPLPPAEQGDTPVLVTTVPAEILPHTFYYLGIDNSTGLSQVFRVERDGKTQTQLTNELVDVLDYDVSLADGHIVYEVDNQLILVNANGSDRLVIDGGRYPVFSPDGKTIAYSSNGITLYDISTSVSTLALEDQLLEGPAFYGLETYAPEKYSPDGTKLIIHLMHSDTSTIAIYYPANNSMVQLNCAEDNYICSDGAGAWFDSDYEWSADSSGFYAAVPTATSTYAGESLLRVDATTGAVTTFAPAGNGMIERHKELYLAPNGELYFFFGTYDVNSGLFDAPTLNPVRSESDDMTDPAILMNENFVLMKEALWSSDASFVIVTYAPMQDVYEGGQAEIVYLDGKPNIVLTTFAQQMKWGP
jgi:hypothetical protein